MQGGLTLLPSPCSSQVAHSLSVTTNKMGDLRYYAQVGEGGRGQEGWEGHTLRCLSNLLASQGACTLPLSHLCITPPPPLRTTSRHAHAHFIPRAGWALALPHLLTPPPFTGLRGCLRPVPPGAGTTQGAVPHDGVTPAGGGGCSQHPRSGYCLDRRRGEAGGITTAIRRQQGAVAWVSPFLNSENVFVRHANCVLPCPVLVHPPGAGCGSLTHQGCRR